MHDIALVPDHFDPNEAMDGFAKTNQAAGAIVTFVGRVRPDGAVEALELSHYAPLTLPGMIALADDAMSRWNLTGLLVRHRVGILYPGEPIVLVSTAARHRRDAYEANDFLMDHLKSAAWFWKRERRSDGWHWIEPRGQDHTDLARWD